MAIVQQTRSGFFLALRRQGKTLELSDYRLMWTNDATCPQLLPLAEGPAVVLKRGRLNLIDALAWPRDDERGTVSPTGPALLKRRSGQTEASVAPPVQLHWRMK